MSAREDLFASLRVGRTTPLVRTLRDLAAEMARLSERPGQDARYYAGKHDAYLLAAEIVGNAE